MRTAVGMVQWLQCESRSQVRKNAREMLCLFPEYCIVAKQNSYIGRSWLTV